MTPKTVYQRFRKKRITSVTRLEYDKRSYNDDNDIERRKKQKLAYYEMFTCKYPISYITMTADHDRGSPCNSTARLIMTILYVS